MLHLRKVIQKFSEKDFKEFSFWLKQNDADKCVQLFLLMRENKLEESDMANELFLSSSAFYALKSRLNGKIQDYFVHNIPDTNIDLLRNVANIPNLLFNFPKEVAITHLLKLEKELIEHDIPHALTTVYSALKKLYRYSSKYFDYSQRYNKHVAYTMAIDKAKELLSDFNKNLGEYLMSRDEKIPDVLVLIRQEMHNYAKLYESHRLLVCQNIMDVEFLLFTPHQETEPDVSVDEVLMNTEKIIKAFHHDANYNFLQTLINFLWFQYYHQQALHKKATNYYSLVNEKIYNLLLNNFCCFPSVFMISKIERSLINNEEAKLLEESRNISAFFSPDIEDVPNYINHVKFKAAAEFYSKKYIESISLLKSLLDTISFTRFPHAEVDVKLFLSVCYLYSNKLELANGMVKNVQRKLRDFRSDEYENARSFAKMLVFSMDRSVKDRDKKILKLRDKFKSENQKKERMLEYLRPDDAFLKAISGKN